MTDALRINARLSPSLSQKVGRVQRRTQATITEIVHAALEEYCASVESEQPLLALLETSGFVACGEGPSDLSSNYKETLQRTLREKTSGAR